MCYYAVEPDSLKRCWGFYKSPNYLHFYSNKFTILAYFVFVSHIGSYVLYYNDRGSIHNFR